MQRSPSPLAQAFWRRYDVTPLDVEPGGVRRAARAAAGGRREPDSPASPYKGLNAFEDSELDALLFFGREREREIVVANLIASRLTVLYGPSGVGKSSLLRAAVARSLRELPEEPLVVVFSRWSDDPAAALAEAVAEAAGGAAERLAPLEALEHAQTDRDVYLVLDQAEEYFLYHADDGGPGSFAEALPGVLGGAAPDQRARLAPRGLAREARPLHGPHPRAVREHASARPARPPGGAGGDRPAGRALRGAHRRVA